MLTMTMTSRNVAALRSFRAGTCSAFWSRIGSRFGLGCGARPWHGPAPAAPLASTAGVVTVALLLLVLAGCNPTVAPPPEVGPTVNGNSVRFIGRPEGLRSELVQDAGDTTLRLPGRLAWNEDLTVRVFSPFSGRLLRPMVQVGDVVAEGQPLAELVSAEFGEAMADARRADTDGRLARDTLTRLRDLHQAGLIPTKELIEAQAMSSRSTIESERARTRLAQVGADGAPASPPRGNHNFFLRAPIAGVVVERAVNPGQEVRSDQGGSPMFVITDPTRLWAWLDATEAMLPRLAEARAGSPIQIRSGAWGDRVFEARLARKEDAIDPASRTFRLRADVDNPARDLKAEMFVSASLALPDDPGGKPVENIPAAAVILVDGRQSVFVQDSDHDFRRVEVKVVRESPGRVGVIGLQRDQRVVVEGNLFLDQLLRKAGPTAARPSDG